MEYIFGTSSRNGQLQENLKTVDTKHSDLSGYINTIREYSDGTKIEDRCKIIKKYASKESNGMCYDWYYITDHYRNVDTSKKIQDSIDSILVSILEK